MDDITDKILNDLEDRGLSMAGFIGQDESGQLQILTYGENGLITYLSRKVNKISISEQLEGNLIKPIIGINNTKNKQK